MPQSELCPHCGTEIGGDAPGGLCPRCLADVGVIGTGTDSDEAASTPAPRAASQTIGDYELLEELGHGGMGMVYRARQLSLGREVAFKVIKPGMDSSQVLARFDAERAALARMDHPNIARVIDAGKVDGPLATLNSQLSISLGRPYFVMELVQGITITRYCDERRLPLRERLELFMSVCHAIQHAHQKGIIHRDIKPSNVLVTVQDGKPVPKVIDFGVAKAIGPRLTEESFVTELGALIGTLEYMSPEQAGLDPADVDTRSDIYALGILLYELLTGTTPFNRKTLKKAAWDELLRLIREQEPPKPSTRQTEQLVAASRESAAASTKSQIVNRKSKIPPDLDWIVMKALEKDRTRRYETSTAFAQDLHRFLQEEPVIARPPSSTYRTIKFVRKHRLAVAVAAAFVVGLTFLTLWAKREQRRAENATTAATANERKATDAKAEAEKALRQSEEARRQADANLSKAREAVTTYLTAVANDRRLQEADLSELRTNLLSAAVPFLRDLARQARPDGSDGIDVAQVLRVLAQIQADMGLWADALSNAVHSDRILRTFLFNQPNSEAIRVALGELTFERASYLHRLGREPEAESLCLEAIATHAKLARDNSGQPKHLWRMAGAQSHLSCFLFEAGRVRDAKTNYYQAVETLRGLVANQPHSREFKRELVMVLRNGEFYLRTNGEPPAERTNGMILAIQLAQELCQSQAPTIDDRALLALLWSDLGDFQSKLDHREAERSLDVAMRMWDELVRQFPSRPDFQLGLASSWDRRGQLLSRTSRSDEGEKASLKSYDLHEGLVTRFPNYLEARVSFAVICDSSANRAQQGTNIPKARAFLEKELEQREFLIKVAPGNSRYRSALADNRCHLGTLLMKEGQYSEAEPHLTNAYQDQRTLTSEISDVYRLLTGFAHTCSELGRLYEKTGRNEEEIRVRKEGLNVLERLAKSQTHSITVIDGLAKDSFSLAQSLGQKAKTAERMAEIHLARILYNEAKGGYETTIKWAQAYLEEFPETKDMRFVQAAASKNLAGVLENLGDKSEALKSYSRAKPILQDLTAHFPDEELYRRFYQSTQRHIQRLNSEVPR